MQYCGKQADEVVQGLVFLWGSIGVGPVQGRTYAEAAL